MSFGIYIEKLFALLKLYGKVDGMRYEVYLIEVEIEVIYQ